MLGRAAAASPALVAVLRVKGLMKVRERLKPEAVVLLTAFLKGAAADPLETPHLAFITNLVQLLKR